MFKKFKRPAKIGVLSIALSLLIAGTASAHVVVRPGEVLVAARDTYAVSVPNEHDTPVVNVRLLIPEGLTSVRPFAKAGWDIEIAWSGEGENTLVTEITWSTGGRGVPEDMKDDFLFGAKAPEEATELKWKAYETYQDGTVVAWDQEPSEAEDNRPYSVTKVVGETAAQTSVKRAEQAAADADKAADRAFYLGLIAGVLGLAGIVLAQRKN